MSLPTLQVPPNHKSLNLSVLYPRSIVPLVEAPVALLGAITELVSNNPEPIELPLPPISLR